jgi:hypothetical protein
MFISNQGVARVDGLRQRVESTSFNITSLKDMLTQLRVLQVLAGLYNLTDKVCLFLWNFGLKVQTMVDKTARYASEFDEITSSMIIDKFSEQEDAAMMAVEDAIFEQQKELLQVKGEAMGNLMANMES